MESVKPPAKALVTICGVIALSVLLLIAINPKNIPLYALWLPFVYIGVSWYLLQSRVSMIVRSSEHLPFAVRARALLNAVVITAFFMLQSVERTAFRELILLIVLVVLGHFYLRRRYG